jgi:hypothetical protein
MQNVGNRFASDLEQERRYLRRDEDTVTNVPAVAVVCTFTRESYKALHRFSIATHVPTAVNEEQSDLKPCQTGC